MVASRSATRAASSPSQASASSNERIAGYGLGRFTMSGRGTIGGTPFTAEVLGGTLLAIDPDQPYPFTADIRLALPASSLRATSRTRSTSASSGPRPTSAGRIWPTSTVSPVSPCQTRRPTTSPRGFSRRSEDRRRQHPRPHRLQRPLRPPAAAGDQRPAGHDRSVASRRLKLADPTAVIGAPRAVIKGATVSPRQQAEAARLTAEHRIPPDARLDVAREDMDADVERRADTVDAGPLPVREVLVHARLDHGLLTLDPGVACPGRRERSPGGCGSMRRGATPQVAADISLARADIGELVGWATRKPGQWAAASRGGRGARGRRGVGAASGRRRQRRGGGGRAAVSCVACSPS